MCDCPTEEKEVVAQSIACNSGYTAHGPIYLVCKRCVKAVKVRLHND